jgi:thymidylate kinase
VTVAIVLPRLYIIEGIPGSGKNTLAQALLRVLHRFPNLRLAATPESLRWRRGLLVRGLEKLPLAF